MHQTRSHPLIKDLYIPLNGRYQQKGSTYPKEARFLGWGFEVIHERIEYPGGRVLSFQIGVYGKREMTSRFYATIRHLYVTLLGIYDISGLERIGVT